MMLTHDIFDDMRRSSKTYKTTTKYVRASILAVLFFITPVDQVFCQLTFGHFAIHNVHIIDVDSMQLARNKTIVIAGDRIIGIHNSSTYVAPDSVQLLDYSGFFVSPGLMDAHVHVGTDPTEWNDLNTTKKRLDYLLRNGITTVRDMAGDARYLGYLSRQASLDEISSPDIYYSALMAGDAFFSDPRTLQSAKGYAPGQAPCSSSL